MQMLDSDITKRDKNQNQKQFSVGNRSLHVEQYPFLTEFSELISKVSIKVLKDILLSPEQKMLAETRYQADKSKKMLYDEYKPREKEIRDYYESVLMIDHKRQWDEHRKFANIRQDSLLE
tara:strand:- start:101 stop:460 length:360 start_codon:yes stop_codon:yes gene_type:complete